MGLAMYIFLEKIIFCKNNKKNENKKKNITFAKNKNVNMQTSEYLNKFVVINVL